MSRLLIFGPLGIAAALAACSPEPEPPRPALAFRTDGATYVWSATGGSAPALVLGQSGAGAGPPALVLSCRGEASGGLRVGALIAEPVPVPIELTAGSATLTVATRRVVTETRVELEGEGDLPPGWFDALAATDMLRLRYGDQGLELEGPGRALTEGWRGRCRTLDRAAR